MRVRMTLQMEEPEYLSPMMQAFEWVLIKRFDIIRIERNQTQAMPAPDPTLEFGLFYEAEVVRVATLPPLMEKALSMRPSTDPWKIAWEKVEPAVLEGEEQKALPAPERGGCREGGYL